MTSELSIVSLSMCGNYATAPTIKRFAHCHIKAMGHSILYPHPTIEVLCIYLSPQQGTWKCRHTNHPLEFLKDQRCRHKYPFRNGLLRPPFPLDFQVPQCGGGDPDVKWNGPIPQPYPLKMPRNHFQGNPFQTVFFHSLSSNRSVHAPCMCCNFLWL